LIVQNSVAISETSGTRPHEIAAEEEGEEEEPNLAIVHNSVSVSETSETLPLHVDVETEEEKPDRVIDHNSVAIFGRSSAQPQRVAVESEEEKPDLAIVHNSVDIPERSPTEPRQIALEAESDKPDLLIVQTSIAAPERSSVEPQQVAADVAEEKRDLFTVQDSVTFFGESEAQPHPEEPAGLLSHLADQLVALEPSGHEAISTVGPTMFTSPPDLGSFFEQGAESRPSSLPVDDIDSFLSRRPRPRGPRSCPGLHGRLTCRRLPKFARLRLPWRCRLCWTLERGVPTRSSTTSSRGKCGGPWSSPGCRWLGTKRTSSPEARPCRWRCSRRPGRRRPQSCRADMRRLGSTRIWGRLRGRRHGGKKHRGHSGWSRKQSTKELTSFSFD
jgi:hypothetical protein